mgnify:CR=1 FL=1
MKKFFITTPIYYLNAEPHIGHAYTTLAADVVARYKKQKNIDTYFLTGTDEHGANIEKSANTAGISPKQWTDNMSEKFRTMWQDLDIKYDDLINLGSYTACKEKGLVRMEGKTYVVEDGDIIVFHFND